MQVFLHITLDGVMFFCVRMECLYWLINHFDIIKNNSSFTNRDFKQDGQRWCIVQRDKPRVRRRERNKRKITALKTLLMHF